MKRETKQMIFIYLLVFIIMVLLIFLTKIILDNNQKPEEIPVETEIEEVNINPYPTVNKECTFSVTYNQYNALTAAGCKGGYTRYNLTDVTVNNEAVNVSIIYSDLENSTKKINEGLFINDKKMTSIVDSVAKIKFGIFDNKLFVLDTNNKESNAYAFDPSGKKIYDLKQVLNTHKIKDLSTGDTNINVSVLNPNTFKFTEGVIEFDSISNNCQNGEASKGSHYKITYSNDKFELPEFINLINCG
ncbi:MAG: hypothetical protein IKG27_00565 [Bacilli bacterium]|nr:hypothetical protein [Bacilli bacterium]